MKSIKDQSESVGNSKSKEGLRKGAEQHVNEGQAAWECGSGVVKQGNTGAQQNGRKEEGARQQRMDSSKGVGKRVVKIEY